MQLLNSIIDPHIVEVCGERLQEEGERVHAARKGNTSIVAVTPRPRTRVGF